MSSCVTSELNLKNVYIAIGVFIVWLIGWIVILRVKTVRGTHGFELPFYSRKKSTSKIEYILLVWEFFQLISFSLLTHCIFNLNDAGDESFSIFVLSIGSLLAFWLVFAVGFFLCGILAVGHCCFTGTVYDAGDEDDMDTWELLSVELFYFFYERADMLFTPLPAFFLSYMICDSNGSIVEIPSASCWKGTQGVGYSLAAFIFFILSYSWLVFRAITKEYLKMDRIASTRGYAAMAYIGITIDEKLFDNLYQDKYGAIIMQLKSGFFLFSNIFYNTTAVTIILNICLCVILIGLFLIYPPNYVKSHTGIRIILLSVCGLTSLAIALSIFTTLSTLILRWSLLGLSILITLLILHFTVPLPQSTSLKSSPDEERGTEIINNPIQNQSNASPSSPSPSSPSSKRDLFLKIWNGTYVIGDAIDEEQNQIAHLYRKGFINQLDSVQLLYEICQQTTPYPPLARLYLKRLIMRKPRIASFYHDFDLETRDIAWVHSAHQVDNLYATEFLSFMKLHGLQINKNPIESFQLMLHAANAGLDIAQHATAACYQVGTGTSINYNQAIHYFQAAVNQGYVPSMNGLANLYSSPDERELKHYCNVERAKELYEQGIAGGCDVASRNLGRMYLTGDGGLGVKPLEAFRLYKISADRGSDVAQYYVGLMYQNGDCGTEKDLKMAMKYFKEAARIGNSEAKSALWKLQFIPNLFL